MFKWLFHILIFATSGKYQNKEKPLKRQRKLGLGSWLPISFFIVFQTFSMELISGKFPGYFRMCISLHSRNVLVHLDLWNG